MKSNTNLLSNPFYSPFQSVLIKGAEEAGQWVVYLEASNELQDQDGETVDMAALKKAADYFRTRGVLSWDHKHKMLNDPGYIIGEPLDVRFSDDRKTLVKGFLYKSNDIAQKVWKNIKSGTTRLGASIGGGILKKSENTIKQVIWDETAITHKPVNDQTMGNVQIIPFTAFAKALMAGSGVDSSEFFGGRALTHESLQGNLVDLEDPRKLFNVLLSHIRNGEISDYNDMVEFVYSRGYDDVTAVKLINYLSQKIPNVVRSGR